MAHYDPRKLGAKCDECPWRDQTPVPPTAALHPRLIVIAETPGEREVEELKPLVGQTGQYFDQILEYWGIPRDQLHLTNTCLCRPERNASKQDYNWAMHCCHPRLVNELAHLEGEVSTILALGNMAVQATLGGAQASHWFGPPEPARNLLIDGRPLKFNVVSSFHPAYALPNRSSQYGGAVAEMVNRAWRDAHNLIQPWAWPELVTDQNSELEIIEAIHKLRACGRVGTDVETAMIERQHDLEERGKSLYNVGLASRRIGLAVSTTWYKSSWRVKEAFMLALDDPELVKVMQWGDYDARIFSINKLALKGYDIDVGVLHSLTHPRQKHDLAYEAALEFENAPRWKDEFRSGKKGDFLSKADEQSRAEYNSKDAYIQDCLAEEGLERLKQVHNGEEIYHKEIMPAWRVGIEMWKVGIKLDIEKLEELKQPILESYQSAVGRCQAITDWLGFTDFGKPTGKKGAKVSAPKSFSPHNSGQIARVFADFLKLPSKRKTDLGAPSYDEEALFLMTEHGGPAGELARDILSAREWHKRLLYVRDLPVWKSDGCIHPEWAPARAATLRWSCPGFPIQTIPKRSSEGKKLRMMFIPGDDEWMVIADYHQEEARFEALFSGEQALMEAFRLEINPYSVVGAKLFGGSAASHAKGTASYNCAKIAFLALIYGVSDQKLREQMRGGGFSNIDLLRVMKVRSAFFLGFPRIVEYMAERARLAHKNDYVECLVSGYRYPYYGQVEDTHVWNFTNQRGGSYLMNHGIVKVFNNLGRDEHIRLSVHDEVVITGPDPRRLVGILLDTLPVEVSYDGRKMYFPIELSVAKKGLSYEAKDKQGNQVTRMAETWGTAAPWEVIERIL